MKKPKNRSEQTVRKRTKRVGLDAVGSQFRSPLDVDGREQGQRAWTNPIAILLLRRARKFPERLPPQTKNCMSIVSVNSDVMVVVVDVVKVRLRKGRAFWTRRCPVCINFSIVLGFGTVVGAVCVIWIWSATSRE